MSRTTTPDSFVENKASTGETGSEKKETENSSSACGEPCPELVEVVVEFIPRPHVIKNILSYSNALKVKKSENLGQVENLMN